jgi:hypothetical protein|tara:strand:+ start:28479 stop:28793 length:315 start_codon:yes stop_codon:yes gene_type:complete
MKDLWKRFTAWLSGWPESSKYGRDDHEQDFLFAEEENKIIERHLLDSLKREKEYEKKEKKNQKTKPLKLMNKRELEEYGRTIGIELDRRHTKERLITIIGEHSG